MDAYLGTGMAGGDKSLRLNLADTIRLAWADEDLRTRLKFVFFIFAVYVVGTYIPVPIPGVDPARFEDAVRSNQLFNLMSTFSGGSLKRISIFALGLAPYITASIIMQVAQVAFPQLKAEMKEGGAYARQKMNKYTKLLTLVLCYLQGIGIWTAIKNTGAVPPGSQTFITTLMVVTFWTAGAFFVLWLGEQISEKGIGNGISLMIFAGIIISFPLIVQQIYQAVANGTTSIFSVILTAVMFTVMTWFIVYFTIAQRRIPITPLRRQVGNKTVAGGGQSYLPFALNMVGVIPIIFAVSLVYMPMQFASFFPVGTGPHNAFMSIAEFTSPNFSNWKGIVGAVFYMFLIFFFTYFYTAMQFNVDDIADNLKRGNTMVPGVRPGKQTRDFLDAVISRITFVGAFFLAVVALSQYFIPLIINIQSLSIIFGTSLLIMVSVALETMRQIEANLLMKQYNF